MNVVPLEQVSEAIDYGVTASASEKPVGPKFLRITDIQNGSVNWDAVPYCQAAPKKLAGSRLRPGDIVFARTGATTGKSFLIRECPEGSVFASYLIRVRPGPEIDPLYLSYFFDSPAYWVQIRSKAQGAAQPGVNSTKLKELKVPTPTLDEQRRIGAILDQANALRRLRRRSIERLNELGQSIFYNLFVTSSESWPSKPLSSLGAIVTGSTPPSLNKEFFDGSVPFVTPGDLESDAPVKRYLSEDGALRSRVVAAEATFVCCIGATIGKIDQARERSAFNQQINAVQWNNKIAPEYGIYAMKSLRDVIIHRGKGASTTLPILKKSEFAKLTIPVPPKEMQRQFAQQLRIIHAHQERLKHALEEMERLFFSLQQRAFRWEL